MSDKQKELFKKILTPSDIAKEKMKGQGIDITIIDDTSDDWSLKGKKYNPKEWWKLGYDCVPSYSEDIISVLRQKLIEDFSRKINFELKTFSKVQITEKDVERIINKRFGVEE